MKNSITSLRGKLLLAMPNMGDPRFHRAVIFMCTHDESGSMGIVINHLMPNMTLGDLFEEIKCEVKREEDAKISILMGGPVETGRGFLVHTLDYDSPETIRVSDQFGVSGTIEALKSFAEGHGPKDVLFALGYSGWNKGQLEQEIRDNAWLVVDADYELIFNTNIFDRWDRAMSRHGIDPNRLSGYAGNA